MDEDALNKRLPSTELLIDKEATIVGTADGSKWNDKIENTTKEIGETSKAFKLMHIEMARYYSGIYKIYAYLGIFIGPFAGVITGLQSSFSFSDELASIITIFVTIISFLSGTIVAIIKFGKFDEASSAHKLAASRYTSLESNVRRQLSLYRVDRPPAKIYLEWITKSIDELFLASPLIPYKVYAIYQPNDKYNDKITIETGEGSVKELADLSEIKVVSLEKKSAEEESDPTAVESTPHEVHPEIGGVVGASSSQLHIPESGTTPSRDPDKKHHTIHKKDSRMNYTYDLGRFKSEQMNYELKRFMNMT
jgi:hypothetical protein